MDNFSSNAIQKLPSFEYAYDKAREFILKIIPSSNPESILEHYLSFPDKSKSPMTVNDLYFRLLISAQNANMKARVIGGSIGGIDKLSSVLCNFNPQNVFNTYRDSDLAREKRIP